jgi:hypothetical protein
MNRLLIPILCAGALAVMAAGCDDGVQGGAPWSPGLDEGDDGTDPGGDADTEADVGTDVDTGTGEPPVDLSGTWAMLLDVSVIQGGLPILGSSPVESRNWYLVEAAPDGDGGLVTSERLCSVQLVPDTWADRPVVPPAFVEHLSPLVRHVSPGKGASWISDRVCEVRGARLCDPAEDLLPGPDQAAGGGTGCDEPCDGAACDQDEDVEPGMTTLLTGFFSCAIHAVHRWCSRLEGAAEDEDTVSGLVTGFSSEQVVLGASSSFCQTGAAVAVPDPCAARQYFEMVRLPAGASCDDVLELTGCDEDPEGCAQAPALPLDPRGEDDFDACP